MTYGDLFRNGRNSPLLAGLLIQTLPEGPRHGTGRNDAPTAIAPAKVTAPRLRSAGKRSPRLARPLTLALLLAGPALAPASAQEPAKALFREAPRDALPPVKPGERKFSMAASAADLDHDGDVDLVVASEFAANRILINDGKGTFTDESAARLAAIQGDHEDVAVADFDRDGDLDLIFVGEDDQVNGYHLNDGKGYFTDVTARLPRRGTSNAVIALDADRDGDADLAVGNNGQDFLFINDGNGFFSDATAKRLPHSGDVTQDIASGDIDGDRDLDLVLGNEDGNKLLLNDGRGHFTLAQSAQLPLPKEPEETRNVDLADVDRDGDLDLYVSNVRLFRKRANPQDRLLLNDGKGNFLDVTRAHVPPEGESTMSAALLDVTGDQWPDLVTGNFGDLTGRSALAPYRLLINAGGGRFQFSAEALPAGVTGNGMDIEPADYNGDGFVDLFLASRGGPDRLLLGTGSSGR